jgi:hypothetical protein
MEDHAIDPRLVELSIHDRNNPHHHSREDATMDGHSVRRSGIALSAGIE